MKRENCLVCKSSEISTVLDLGLHPFADTFIPKNMLDLTEPIHPLCVDLCCKCGHIQTHVKTNPDDRYTKYEYSFLSSSSQIAKKHWENYANDINKVKKIKNQFVIEIGSNDGFLGECFQNKGAAYLGIDASPTMVDIANEKGIETWQGFFNLKIAKKILEKKKKATIVTANNVFNHIDDLNEFIYAINLILDDDGIFVFEVPYWLIEFEKKNFGKIYHEHVNYFTISSLKKLFDSHKLKISDIIINDYHGGTMRVTVNKTYENNKLISTFIDNEIKSGVFRKTNYSEISNFLNEQRVLLIQKLLSYKNKKIPIIGIGAAAKGNTFLNFHNLDFKLIDYITDISPSKKGKYTPLSRIPIVGDDIFSKYDKVVALVLTENISPKLKTILLKINPKIVFIETT